MLRVLNNSQIDAEAEKLASEQWQATPLVSGLASYLKLCWEAARDAKMPINDRMLRSLRQRNGEYEPTKLNEIQKTGGSEIYMQLTEVKCRAAESWVRDILLNDGAPPWSLSPTPIPDISPEQEERIAKEVTTQALQSIMMTGMAPDPQMIEMIKEEMAEQYKRKAQEEAEERTEQMEQKIRDQLADGGWLKSFDEFITDLSTYSAAFLKGPVLRRQYQLDWGRNELGEIAPQTVEKIIPCYERVDPFRVYPEPGIADIEDGYLFQHHKLSRSDLSALIGVPGYDDTAIREILDSSNTGNLGGWLESTEISRADQERRFSSWTRPTLMIDALEFYGKINGKMMLDWGGITDVPFDEAKEYDVNVWMIDRWVIKAVVNPDPLGRKPYYKTSFFKTPGAFWGRGIPEVMWDTQQMVNAAARSLSNNMGISSGPQVEVNMDRLPPGETITSLYPWKIWQVTNDPLGGSGKALNFNQPDSHAQELMGVLHEFNKLADDHTGIPAYVYGDTDVSGAGRTASGLSMLMGSAGKGLRQVVMYIDNDIVRPLIQRQYDFNMKYDPDSSIKGDCEVIAKGAVNLAVKEQLNMRRIEFLNATANPVDLQIVGLKGRAAILREVAKELNMPTDEIIPDKDELERQEMMMQMQQQATAAPSDGGPNNEGTPAKPPENKNPPGDTQQTFASGGKVGEEVQFVRGEDGVIQGARFGAVGGSPTPPVPPAPTPAQSPQLEPLIQQVMQTSAKTQSHVGELSSMLQRALALQTSGKVPVRGPDGKIAGFKVGNSGFIAVERDSNGRVTGLGALQ